MVGLGYKDFVNGAIADASEADGYFMQQTIMRFASAAARDSALSAVLADGLHAYTSDTKTFWSYNGSAWVPVVTGPATLTTVQDTSGSTTSTTYTATLTGGTTCSIVFVAPTTGRVEIVNTGQLANSAASAEYQGIEVREGGVVGSGTVVLAAADADAIVAHLAATAPLRASVTKIVTGLTPGATYNTRQMFRAAAGTGFFSLKTLSVKAVP